MINWLLGFLPAPLKYAINGVGVIAYLIALIKPGSAVSAICMAVATITGAAGLVSAAKDSIEKGKQLAQTTAAMKVEEAPKPVESPVSDPGVASGVTDQSTAGHTQQAADDYLDSISKP